MYEATITVQGNPDFIEKSFQAEESGRNDRSNFTLHKLSTGVEFKITAKDSVALRAVLNSITKSLTILEKIKEVIK